MSKFDEIKKYLINDKKFYLDIDKQFEWDLALTKFEFIIKEYEVL